MASPKIRLDHGGIADVLKSGKVAAVVNAQAANVAGHLSGETADGEPVEILTGSYVSDRAAASVTMAHPAAQRIEAKRGSLVRAAAAAGLEVRARSRGD